MYTTLASVGFTTKPSPSSRSTTTASKTGSTSSYEDKLDGPIDAPFFDHRAKEFRTHQITIVKSIEDYRSDNQSYVEEGIPILELASRAAELFEKQPAEENCRLLNCDLKGASRQHCNLKADFHEPFGMLKKTALSNAPSDSRKTQSKLRWAKRRFGAPRQNRTRPASQH